jgi:hypothetical protein
LAQYIGTPALFRKPAMMGWGADKHIPALTQSIDLISLLLHRELEESFSNVF